MQRKKQQTCLEQERSRPEPCAHREESEMHAPFTNYTRSLYYRDGRVSEKLVLRSDRRKLLAAPTTRVRRGAPLRGGREKKGLKVAVVRHMGASASGRVQAGRPLPRSQPQPQPRPVPNPNPVCCFPQFIFIFIFINFFWRSHISKKRLLVCTPKFSVMNFRILWSTKPNSTEIHRNIYLYFPMIIELSVKSYGVFKVFLPNLS